MNRQSYEARTREMQIAEARANAIGEAERMARDEIDGQRYDARDADAISLAKEREAKRYGHAPVVPLTNDEKRANAKRQARARAKAKAARHARKGARC